MSQDALRRVPTGIPGLDEAIKGGFLDHTVTAVAGASGTGKSALAMQFLLAGLDQDEQGLYITTGATPAQVVESARLWGWEGMADYVDRHLFFFATGGRGLRELMDTQLSRLVEVRRKHQTVMRVVIDPLTPVIWTAGGPDELREQTARLFDLFREIGPLLVTLEDYGAVGGGTGMELSINNVALGVPLFLADNALFLRARPTQEGWQRTLEIIKARGTDPGPGVYPYAFAHGQGLVVNRSP